MGVLQDRFPGAGKGGLQDMVVNMEKKKQSHTVQLLSSKEKVEIRVGDKVRRDREEGWTDRWADRQTDVRKGGRGRGKDEQGGREGGREGWEGRGRRK